MRRFNTDDVVLRPVFVITINLIAIAGLEQVEEVPDEVVNLDDRVVAEPGMGIWALAGSLGLAGMESGPKWGQT